MRRLAAVGAGAVALGLALPAAAPATLVYTTQGSRGAPAVWAAEDDGSQRRRLGSGLYSPQISPDGQAVATFRQTRTGANQLALVPAAGGAVTTGPRSAGYLTLAWSPDSRTLAMASGRRLLLVDAASGQVIRRLATGNFTGTAVSFSPLGDRVAYSVARSTRLNAPTNIFSVPVEGGDPAQLTTDGLSDSPIWGPTQIAYSSGPTRRQDYPRRNVWLMNPDGTGHRQLTRVRVGRLVSGLYPLEWSADGSRLVANFAGQDTQQAFAVDPLTGAARDLGAMRFDGTSASAISRDGTTVLAGTGGLEGPPTDATAIVTIPFEGGASTVLVRRALSPDWNR